MTFQPKVFSPEVEKALRNVCPSEDPIDQPDFDPIAYLNAKFPDEASLSKLPAFHDEITKRLQRTEHELFRAVEVQATTATSATKDLREVSSTVSKLNDRVAEIRKKATKSEDTVRELCQNIRQLDTAKSNLTLSVNTLRSIQLWMLQLQTLSVTFNRRNYVQCRDALKEVQKYAALFEQYKEVPKVKELNEKQSTLCRQIEYYIRNNVIGDMTSIDEDVMAEACAVIDALGNESIKKVRDKYIERELDIYMTKFKRGSDDAKLDKTERRYVFIRQLLENNRSMFETVFPRHWCVPQELCVTFCLRTKSEFDYLLRESAGNIDVAVLTYVLQKTIDIERELTVLTAWRDHFPERSQLPDYRYNGMILSAFKAHMGLFVENENKLMEEALQATAQDETLRDDAHLRVGTVMSMADDIFVFIKESLKRTIKVSQQHILIDMAAVWRKHLVRFATNVGQLIPNPPSNSAQWKKTCVIINTADLCQSTSTALGEEVAIRAEVGVDEVNFEEVEASFSTLYSTAIGAVVNGLDKLLVPSFTEFGNGAFMNNQADESHDESPYVAVIRRQCHEVVNTCAAVLQPQMLRFLLDKIASNIIPKYALYFYRLRRPTSIMVAQTRVDCTALEKMFLALPNVGNPDRFPQSMLTHYSKLVRREFDRLNRALKVVQCEASDAFVDVYYEVTSPEDRSVQNFMRLVELKGLRREDVRPWIVALSKKGVVESTKRDVQRDNQIQSLGAASASAAQTARPTTGFFGGTTDTTASAASPVLEGVASGFRSAIRPISNATNFLTGLKDRVAISKEKEGGK
ncbi:membrane trafficking protein, Vps53-like, putative [Bodo saltans]|uniref:Membrane trafficking protein, Vps53-like, putative n=1 Tax=Bodo saltans TaxID=75058 RepID=A0A0S4J071_BODSA|nr:membrane trafficking protein, Vps53-like, putative [Bodo saltans]|eukprot:CUG34888.1 membrane trafficking protein, Vps53-like, putative [Bodo saltans]